MTRRGKGRSFIGTSGWQYAGWRGPVYPAEIPKRSWWEHYTTLFDSVELNSTFYRLPTTAAVEGWAADAPDRFIYAVKLGQFGTHRMKLRDAGSWVANHVDRLERLGPHAGPTLVQLPPKWKRDVARLDEFLTVATSSGPYRWAVELRDPSWYDDETDEVLRRHGAALCLHDLSGAFPTLERTTDWVYVRFHGPHASSHPYWGRYTGRRLHPWVDRLRSWLDDGVDVYSYFNNDHEGHAVVDARWLVAHLD